MQAEPSPLSTNQLPRVSLLLGICVWVLVACSNQPASTGPSKSVSGSVHTLSSPATETLATPTELARFVLTATGSATADQLGKSAEVFRQRLVRFTDVTVTAQPPDQLIITGPTQSSEALRQALTTGHLSFRPVLRSAPGNGTGWTGTTPVPLQPAGSASATWLREVTAGLATLGCGDLADHLNEDKSQSIADLQLLVCDKEGAVVYLLDSAIISGTEVKSAEARSGPHGWEVLMTLGELGQQRWANYTTGNIGVQVAFVFDTKVISAPIINAAITDPSTSITGNFTEATATDLAAALNAGELPVTFTIAEG